MKILLYLITGLAFLSQFRDFEKMLGAAGRIVTLAPEALSGILLVALLLVLGSRRSLALSPKYVIVGLILLVHLILGAILNQISPGVMVGGIRTYFAFTPLFLLPAVYEFSEQELKQYFKFVVVLALLQLLISLYQRVFIFPFVPTGDVVRGTFPSGAIMSTFLISVVAVMVGMYLRGYLQRWLLIVLSGLMLVPTMINETKGTIILLPIALVGIGAYFGAMIGRVRIIFGVLGVSVLFVVVFSIAYEWYFPEKESLYTFFSEGFFGKVYKDQEQPNIGSIGRLDSVVYAYQTLSPDATKLAFGLGVGNVSDPNTISVVKGEYEEYFVNYGAGVTTYATLLWHTGVIGIFLTLLTVLFLFLDAKFVYRADSFIGALSLGWIGLMCMVPVAFMYKSYIFSNVISVVAMFVAGLVASSRMRSAAKVPERDHEVFVPNAGLVYSGPTLLRRD